MSIVAQAGGLEIHPHDISQWGSAQFCGWEAEVCDHVPLICIGGQPLCLPHAIKAHSAAIDKARQDAYWAADKRVMV